MCWAPRWCARRIYRPRAWGRRSSRAWAGAFPGGLGGGVGTSTDAIRKAWKVGKVFKPKMKADARERHLTKWRRAVGRAEERRSMARGTTKVTSEGLQAVPP